MTLLIGEIQRNCDFVLLAHKDMVRCLESMKLGDKEAIDRFWLSVESFLITVANISKILWLWPSPPCGFELSTEVSSRRACGYEDFIGFNIRLELIVR